MLTVSSNSHYSTWFDPKVEKKPLFYFGLWAYKVSKLSNVLFTQRFNRMMGGTPPAFAVDPGLVNTDIGLKDPSALAQWVWRGRQKIGDSPEKPSKTILHLAQVEGLDCLKDPYWRDCIPKPASRAAWNDGLIERVWQESCCLCGIPTRVEKSRIGCEMEIKNLKIRLASLKDAAGIARVQVDSYLSAYRDLLPDEYLANFTYKEQEKDWQGWQKEHPQDILLVAEESVAVIGYALSRDVVEEPGWGEVAALACLPAAQTEGDRKGVIQGMRTKTAMSTDAGLCSSGRLRATHHADSMSTWGVNWTARNTGLLKNWGSTRLKCVTGGKISAAFYEPGQDLRFTFKDGDLGRMVERCRVCRERRWRGQPGSQ